MLDHVTRLQLIQDDRRREIESLQRARMGRSAAPRPTRNPTGRHPARWLPRART